MIGLLTEIIGSPTPTQIPLVADKQLPTGDWPLPVVPQLWHYRQSIDYDVTNNRAILNYASRNRETLLYNLYLMGRNSIRNGSEDHWTITPDRIDALRAAAGAEANPRNAEDLSPFNVPHLPLDLYTKILHDPEHRDARGYIIPSDQPDFLTATKFVNALLKVGITVTEASTPFQVNGESYPAGSYVIKTAQAFRPHVLDMFEPQHHPNDFKYPGGPPIPPYDSAGWTLALQMGVHFDRVTSEFDGPFTAVNGLLKPPAGKVAGVAHPAGYLLSHRTNDSFVVVNRLLKAHSDVYWLAANQTVDGHDFGSGAIWVPASAAAAGILDHAAAELGVNALGLAQAPASKALKLKPIRIGLYDQYGGLMPSGWDRWLFEQYEFPFEVVYPQTLDAGDLKNKFDVLVFTDGAYRQPGARRSEGFSNRQPKPADIPEQYRAWLGHITTEKTVPQLQQFLSAGGSVVTIGSSTALGELLGVPVSNYLTQMGADSKLHPLPSEKYYIPGSLLKVSVDNSNPLAYGMPSSADVFFDNSPVFRLAPDAQQKQTTAVAWFASPHSLVSGWAWGQAYLDGGTAVAEAAVGRGKVFLLGPEVTFRAQPHGTFKLLFNSLYDGGAQPAAIGMAAAGAGQ
jgi:hypothetical protein